MHSKEDYKKSIDEVIDFLGGSYKKIIDGLTSQMMEASEKMEYEEAAKYRDLIASVKQVAQKQKITADDSADRDVDEEEINDLLDALQVEHCRDKFPEQMSGGEQQRVAIARALIMHPAVVYADEPTGNLDAESAENVAAMLSLAAAKYRQTIVMVTHDKQMAEYADRILSIVDGHVISDVTE